MLNKKNYYFIYLLLFVFCFSCKPGGKNKELNKDLLSGGLVIHRYEKELFKINPDSLKQKLPILQKQYRFFISGSINDENNIKQLHDYLVDPVVKELYSDCLKKFADLNDIEKPLSEALLDYKSKFPEVKLPRIYSYVSGISNNTSVSYLDSVLVIPLDMYLGSDYPIYDKIGIPKFIRMRFNREYIVKDCIKQIAESKLPAINNKTLLDIMVEKGKVLYFIQSVSKNVSDEINMSYTKEQSKWNKANEANLWSFIIGNKLLFITDNNTINKFTGDTPFTSVISQQAPGRIGEWLGWQIVKSYMQKNKNVTLSMLMKDADSQQILNNSGYKPKK